MFSGASFGRRAIELAAWIDQISCRLSLPYSLLITSRRGFLFERIEKISAQNKPSASRQMAESGQITLSHWSPRPSGSCDHECQLYLSRTIAANTNSADGARSYNESVGEKSVEWLAEWSIGFPEDCDFLLLMIWVRAERLY